MQPQMMLFIKRIVILGMDFNNIRIQQVAESVFNKLQMAPKAGFAR